VYGESFYIQRSINGGWRRVFSDVETDFAKTQYVLETNATLGRWQRESFAYDLSIYAEKMEIGQYRIATYVFSDGQEYKVFAEFEIVRTIPFKVPSQPITEPITALSNLGINAGLSSGSFKWYDHFVLNRDFSSEYALLVLFFTTSNQGNWMRVRHIYIKDGVLTLVYDFHDGMLTAIGSAGVALKIAQSDLEGVERIERERRCNCPPSKTEMIYAILTSEATYEAYNEGKLHTPEDFPEWNFSGVENLFTMRPNSPSFRRILYLHLETPVFHNELNFLNAVRLIGQRADIYYAG
jgi:hypothetical protein